jgi:hypothetical protein
MAEVMDGQIKINMYGFLQVQKAMEVLTGMFKILKIQTVIEIFSLAAKKDNNNNKT